MGKRKSRPKAKAKKAEKIVTPEPAPAPVRQAALPTATDDLWLMAKAVLIVALGFAIYYPAFTGSWLWDDRGLVADNRLVRDPDGWWEIWLRPWMMFDFQPVEVTVAWTAWHLFGEQTLGYHILNLLLHLTSAFLLWRLLHKLGLRHAWLGGLIFTVHPILVESVAWMAELKNTLSLPFFLLAMISWVDYDARGKRGDYIKALVFFALAMLTKATMVMFPFVILLYAWWRHSRVTIKDVLASLPFLVVSFAVGLGVMAWLNKTYGQQELVIGGPLSRVACAALSISFYFSKCVLPMTLLAIYPRWQVDPPSPIQFLPWPVLAGVIWLLWQKRNTWGRNALMGLGFFLIMLLPFLGLNAGSYMTLTWVMDHILYIPIVGLIGLTVAVIDDLALKLQPTARRAGAVVIAAAIAWMAWASHFYAGIYDSLIAFWEYNGAHSPDSAFTHNNLGVSLASVGRKKEAEEETRTALRINPDYYDALRNLGLFYSDRGEYQKAADQYLRAIHVFPNRPEGRYSLAVTYGLLGRTAESEEMYRSTISVNATYELAYHNLAATLAQEGRLQEAYDVLVTGLQRMPEQTQLSDDLAIVKRQMQQAQKKP